MSATVSQFVLFKLATYAVNPVLEIRCDGAGSDWPVAVKVCRRMYRARRTFKYNTSFPDGKAILLVFIYNPDK
jgi:hypothetical protein